MDISNFLYDNFGPYWFILVVALIGAAIFLVALPKVAVKKTDPLKRLEKSKKNPSDYEEVISISRNTKRNNSFSRVSDLLDVKDNEETNELKKMLYQAGFQDPDAIKMLQMAQLSLCAALFILGFIYVSFIDKDMGTQNTIFAILGPAALGYMLPKIWIKNLSKKRQENILIAFPDALDLILVCVEAGQSMDQAIQRVSLETKDNFPELSNEFDLVNQEIKAGKDKNAVYRDFASRCDTVDISSFVTVLIQAQSHGTSISEALKTYSEEMRDKRLSRAEQKASLIPMKLSMGAMLFCLPTLFLVLLGPPLYDVYLNFKSITN